MIDRLMNPLHGAKLQIIVTSVPTYCRRCHINALEEQAVEMSQ